jgi:hypothetical protein
MPFPEKNIDDGGLEKILTPFLFMACAIVPRIPARKPESPAFLTGRESEIDKIKRFEL